MSFKEKSKKLKKRAMELGHDIPLTHAQELLASVDGFRNRHVALKEKEINSIESYLDSIEYSIEQTSHLFKEYSKISLDEKNMTLDEEIRVLKWMTKNGHWEKWIAPSKDICHLIIESKAFSWNLGVVRIKEINKKIKDPIAFLANEYIESFKKDKLNKVGDKLERENQTLMLLALALKPLEDKEILTKISLNNVSKIINLTNHSFEKEFMNLANLIKKYEKENI